MPGNVRPPDIFRIELSQAWLHALLDASALSGGAAHAALHGGATYGPIATTTPNCSTSHHRIAALPAAFAVVDTSCRPRVGRQLANSDLNLLGDLQRIVDLDV
jgi:hypothetical protein